MSRQVKRMNDRSEAKKMSKWKITEGNIKDVLKRTSKKFNGKCDDSPKNL